MLVYRFEKNGIGPYHFIHDGCEWSKVRHMLLQDHSDANHLTISAECEGRWDSTKHLCACHSLDSLCDWFGEYTDILLLFGFKCVAYLANDVVETISGRQLGFDKTTAKRIGEV